MKETAIRKGRSIASLLFRLSRKSKVGLLRVQSGIRNRVVGITRRRQMLRCSRGPDSIHPQHEGPRYCGEWDEILQHMVSDGTVLTVLPHNCREGDCSTRRVKFLQTPHL
jgi:hypothetical protein